MTELITQAGYITEFTERGAKGRYIGGENTRFRNSLPQKLGGSSHLSSNSFLGVVRTIRSFKSLSLNKYLALASNLRFYIYDGGNLINITPERDSGTLGSGPFTTSAGSSVVTVADTSHGVVAGDVVNLSGASASPIDGTLIDGDYSVVTVIDTNTYTIDISTPVTTTEASFGGASVSYFYEINSGLATSLVGDGWGSGPFNDGTWGTPRTGSDINLPLRTVSIDEWGEDVIFNPRSKAIYVFDTSGGIDETNRATEITAAPDTAYFVIVSPEDRHLIAMGAHDGVNDDPMLVAWCSQGDYTDWIPTAINTAGDQRLDSGTHIVTSIYARSQILIITDTSIYSMHYIGYPEVYSIKFKAKNCGGISPSCAIAHGDTVYWMSDTIEFWKYDGSPIMIPCEIRNWIQERLDTQQQDQVQASLNTDFQEVWWICPNIDGGHFVVVYNYKDNIFWFTVCDNWQTPRTALIDKGKYSNKPIGAGLDGKLWGHEVGTDHESTPLPSNLYRFYDEVADGDDSMMVTRVIPDFRSITGSVYITMKGMEFPQPNSDLEPIPDTKKGPYEFNNQTRKKNIRIRARQIAMVISSTDAGVDWKFGTMRVDAFPIGKKGG